MNFRKDTHNSTHNFSPHSISCLTSLLPIPSHGTQLPQSRCPSCWSTWLFMDCSLCSFHTVLGAQESIHLPYLARGSCVLGEAADAPSTRHAVLSLRPSCLAGALGRKMNQGPVLVSHKP